MRGRRRWRRTAAFVRGLGEFMKILGLLTGWDPKKGDLREFKNPLEEFWGGWDPLEGNFACLSHEGRAPPPKKTPKIPKLPSKRPNPPKFSLKVTPKIELKLLLPSPTAECGLWFGN